MFWTMLETWKRYCILKTEILNLSKIKLCFLQNPSDRSSESFWSPIRILLVVHQNPSGRPSESFWSSIRILLSAHQNPSERPSESFWSSFKIILMELQQSILLPLIPYCPAKEDASSWFLANFQIFAIFRDIMKLWQRKKNKEKTILNQSGF